MQIPTQLVGGGVGDCISSKLPETTFGGALAGTDY